jgi:S1-C subfamily serine protease
MSRQEWNMTGSLAEFSKSLADAVEQVGRYVIAVPEGGREGVSGTLWREGIAVTAAHTIQGYDEVTVTLPSGEERKAAVAGRDRGTDVAVLKFTEPTGSAVFADELHSRVGEIVLAVGRRGAAGLATTFGVISAIGGPWRTWQGARVDRWLRLDLNPFTGFSGGPIVNARGEVLGIATSGPRRSVVTIAASTVEGVVNHVLKHGRVARGYLGIGVQPVAFPQAARHSLGIGSDRGLLVVTIAPGSPADSAGVLLGDIVVAVEGAPVHGIHSLQPALDPDQVGKRIAVELVRGGHRMQLQVTVGERKEG